MTELGPIHRIVKLFPLTGPVMTPLAPSLKDAFCFAVKVASGAVSVVPTTSPA